jgi:glutamate-ammonia-ligase adenylyltransferase
MSCDATETYYDQQGREWERYALIKARVVAGDWRAGRQLMARLRPFVFRRYLDYGVFEALREMKRLIGQEVRRRSMAGNIKLGPGGIREIEFFGQAFQLIRGGVEPGLQQRPIRAVLRSLAEVGLVPPEVAGELDAAYLFLRSVEHRLQAVDDAQTHQLPEEPKARRQLARSMGFVSVKAFDACLERHREAVRRHFGLLLSDDESGHETGQAEAGLEALGSGAMDADEAERMVRRLGYRQPREVLAQLEHLRSHSETRLLSAAGREKLDRLVPQLVRAAAGVAEAEACLARLLELVASVARRTTYLSLLLEHPAALEHLVRLAGASSWIVEFLARHPVLLDELLDPRSLYAPPSRAERRRELRDRLRELAQEEEEFQIEALCVYTQSHILRVAAADVTGALPLMRTSDHLSEIAELVLEEVLCLAWRDLAARHGTPVCDLASASAPRGFAVIAYGKLGGLELGYGSDLDLVFLHAGSAGKLTHGGPRPLDSPQFFARLGQRMVHLLTAHTRAGVLYDIDMRLRPSGASGVLVSQVEAFRDYQLANAWTWEHQALVRARGVAGDPALLQRFEAIRREVLVRPRQIDALRREVVAMRERMRAEHLHAEPGVFDLKQGYGGIVDLEFLVQYLVLARACELPQLARWSDNVRQLETLSATGVLSAPDADALRAAYLALRGAAHRLGLQQRETLVAADELLAQRQTVRRLWRQWFGPDGDSDGECSAPRAR